MTLCFPMIVNVSSLNQSINQSIDKCISKRSRFRTVEGRTEWALFIHIDVQHQFNYPNVFHSVKRTIYIGVMAPESKWWGRGIPVAMEMAIEAVNNRSDVLRGYKVELLRRNTMVAYPLWHLLNLNQHKNMSVSYYTYNVLNGFYETGMVPFVKRARH